MMLFPLFNQYYHTPINLLPMIFFLRVHRSRHRSLPTRTNISTTMHPTNLRNAIARETAGPTRGLTIHWNETTHITMFPPLHISTPYPFRLRGLLDLRPSKHRAFLAARIEDFITIRG